MKFVVTGGRGFIGSHFVEDALERGHYVIDIDKMTYAAHKSLPWDKHERYKLIVDDIQNITHLPPCDVVVNFAAESHVDNSISSSKAFVESNIIGVHNLLELVRGKAYERPLFFQISTDEVYGDTPIKNDAFSEVDMLLPSNPYSASKAAAEMLILSYARTYGVDYVITRSSNNYGQRQYEEKLVAKCISCFKEGKKIPLHGTGQYMRDWIYVKDNVDAIFKIIESDITNETFNIAAGNELKNIDIVKEVMKWFDINENDWEKYINFVDDRLGQDARYALNCDKIQSFTSWRQSKARGLKKII